MKARQTEEEREKTLELFISCKILLIKRELFFFLLIIFEILSLNLKNKKKVAKQEYKCFIIK